MNQLLDENDNIPILKKTFSKLSFGTSILIAILMLYFLTETPSEFKAKDANNMYMPTLLVILMPLACVLGFIFTIISFVKKEPFTLMKWVGAIVNTILILVLVWSVINLLDY